MTVVKTICQGCYYYCGLNVSVDRDRIVRIDGMPEHPVNRGTICPKGLAAQQLVTDPRRLTEPMRRVGKRGSGQWETISWDAALDLVASTLDAARREHGPESLVYHRGHAPGWVTTYNYVTRFMSAFGSPNLVTHAHLCFSPRAIAHVSTYGGVPEPDFDHARCILLWGFNPVETSLPNYARRIVEALARGTKLIVVDPRFTLTAAKADLWLQPRPGTDLALATGIAKILVDEKLYDADFVRDYTVGFDRLTERLADVALDRVASQTGVSVDDMRRAAFLFASHQPGVMKEGNGLDQHVNVVQTVRAVSLIPALTGSINIEGGGVIVPPLRFANVPPGGHRDLQLRSVRAEDWEARSLSMHPLYYRTGMALHDEELFAALETGEPYPIAALFVQGGALVAANSHTARTRRLLDRIPFIAVHDLYRTATAELADLVLPAASFLERDLLLYYRYRPSAQLNMIALQRRVVPPVGGSRADLDAIFDLAARLGMDEEFPWTSPEEAFEAELQPVGITLDDLRRHPEGYQQHYEPSELYWTDGRTRFETASGKVELFAERLAQHGAEPLPTAAPLPASLRPTADYPLLCGTGLKQGIHTHTEFHSLPWIEALEPAPFLEIHPNTADTLSISSGDRVLVESRWGSIPAVARQTESVSPGVVMLAYGYGQPYAGDMWRSSNEITPDGTIAADPDSGATSNRHVPVRLIRAEPAVETHRTQRLLIADTARCVGCHTCEVACLQEHGEPRIRVHTVGPVRTEDGEMRSWSVPICHDGCDLCSERISAGVEPACIAACPTRALSVVRPAVDLTGLGEEIHVCAVRTIPEHAES